MKKALSIGIVACVMLLATISAAMAAFTVTFNTPANNVWSNNSANFTINYTVTGNESSYNCKLNATHAGSTWANWNSKSGYDNGTNTTSVNNTPTTIQATLNSTATLLNTSSSFNYMLDCSVSGVQTNSSNRTSLGIDFTAPAAFSCRGMVNKDYLNGSVYDIRSVWTDYTPDFTWQNSSDTNFSYYRMRLNDSTISPGLWDSEYNVSAGVLVTNLTHNLSNTTVNIDVNVWVAAFDKAGNMQEAGNCSQVIPLFYHTDYTCSRLTSGWNLCGVTTNRAKTAAQICREIPYCGYVSMYNGTHEFQVYTNGSAENENMSFSNSNLLQSFNGSVFIYVNANTTWENRTWEVSANDCFRYNFTNGTSAITTVNRGWNLVPVTNRSCIANLTAMDRSLNGNGTHMKHLGGGNVSFMSISNNSYGVGGNRPFVNNWTINAEHAPQYGEAIWMYWDNDTGLDRFIWNSTANISNGSGIVYTDGVNG